MTKYSLRTYIMIQVLAPVLLLGLLLSTIYMVHRHNALQNQVIRAGASIIEPLSTISEWGMNFHNRENVSQLISLLHRRNANIVRSITIFDDKNTFFATSNPNYNNVLLQLSKNVPVPDALMHTIHDNSLILRMSFMHERPFSEKKNAMANPALGYIAIDLDLQSIRLQQYKEIFIAALFLLFCLCLIALFTLRLMRNVSVPIRHMVNTVDLIRRGQLNNRVEGNMPGELSILKNGINSMAISLAAYHKEMQHNIDQATSNLRNTLEQMELQNSELDLAKKHAQEAVRIKSEFLANMSHELRTPLNGVIGFTRQTLKTPLTPTQKDYLQAIQRSANNLLTIINDVLDFSKLEAEKLMLEQIPFSLRETLDEIVVLLANIAHEKGLELTLHINNKVPEQVTGDAMRLQQIVTNLLGNAIKFTENGNIDIYVYPDFQDEKQLKLGVTIQDTGIGIETHKQSQLFQAFHQADASISRRHGGTGLGLVITQKLVRKMGGEISFYSKPDQGSIFKFYIYLDINETEYTPPVSLIQLTGQLAYVEANPAAARATLNMLSMTGLQVTHRPTLAQLPDQHYNILLVGIPIPFRHNMAVHRDKLLVALKMAESVILALPSQSQVEAETLKQIGAHACLIKPISSNRLFPLLVQNNPQCPVSTVDTLHKTARLPLAVMAVDDNLANLKLIGTLLNEQVEKTIVCKSGKEAIQLAQENHLDIILMDIQMPGMDGIRASELIHQIAHHQHTPIIAVTAHATSGQQEQFLKAGMNGYLAKPINETRLTLALSRHYMQPVQPQPAKPEAQVLMVNHNEWTQSLNWPLALRQAANKEALAQELLLMLLNFLPQVRKRVHLIIKGGEDATILDLIHKLHGSCSYSGVPRLKQLCFYIEQQLRQQISLQDLESEWLELLDEIDNVIYAARIHLEG